MTSALLPDVLTFTVTPTQVISTLFRSPHPLKLTRRHLSMAPYYTLMAKEPLATTATARATAAVPTGDAHPPDTNPSLDPTGPADRRERQR